jgi:hypothetical protein
MISNNLDITYNNVYNITYNNSHFFYIKNNNKEGVINIINKKVIISFRLKGNNITIKYNNINILIKEIMNININLNDTLQIIINKDLNSDLLSTCNLVLYDISITTNNDYLLLKNSIELFNSNITNKNIISYEEICLNNNYTNFYTFYDSNRHNMYIEKDIIDQQIKKNNMNNKDYIDWVYNNFSSGIIINREQLKKIFPNIIIDDTLNIIYNNEKYTLTNFINKYVYNNLDIINNINLILKNNLVDSDLLILIHVGNIELGNNIINRLILKKNNNFLYAFNFNNTLNKDDLSASYSLISNNFINYIITTTNNYGNDIIPSLFLYNYITNTEKIKIKYILKIQTKKNKKNFDDNINTLVTENIPYLINILNNNNQIDSIGTNKYLYKIDSFNLNLIEKVINNKNLNFKDDFSDILYLFNLNFKKFNKKIEIIKKFIPTKFNFINYIFYNNIKISDKNNKYLKIDLIKNYITSEYLSPNNYFKNINKNINPYTFFAGTMFLCKDKIFNNIITNSNNLIKASIINNFYYDNNIFYNNSPIHAIERLFGYEYNNIEISNYNYNQKILISYACYINNEKDVKFLNYHLELLLSTNHVDTLILGYSGNINYNYLINNIYKNNKIIINEYDNIGLDLYKHYNNLIKYDYDRYNYIYLINDSIIFLKNIDYIFDFTYFNNNYDFLSLINSYEKKLHYPSFFWIMKPKIINKFIKTYKKKYNDIINNKINLIDIIEINFTNKLKDKYNCISIYTVSHNYNKNIHFDNNFYNFIKQTNYPIIKKSLLYYYLPSSLFKSYKNSGKELIDFFSNININECNINYEDYKKLNTDIIVLNKDKCNKHFFKIGFYEHRKCDKDNIEILNEKMTDFIKNNINYNKKILNLL